MRKMLLLDFFPYPARYQFVNYLGFFLKKELAM